VPQDNPDKILEIFNKIDTDKSGAIDPDEFRALVRDMHLKMDDVEVMALFKSIDLDGNGTLEFNEFLTWWQNSVSGYGSMSDAAWQLRLGMSEAQLQEATGLVAKKKGEEDKTSNALTRLMDEDPTIIMSRNPVTKEMLVSGMGDQHIEIIMERMKRKFGVEADLRAPQVEYRETIRGKAHVQGKHKKQSGGHGQYGDVRMRFEPLGDTTKAYEFAEEVVGGSVPKNYFPAVEKGLQECVQKGPLANYPVVGVSWIQANNYCDWRTDRLNEKALIDAGILEMDPDQQGDNVFTTISIAEQCGILKSEDDLFRIETVDNNDTALIIIHSSFQKMNLDKIKNKNKKKEIKNNEKICPKMI